LELRQALSEAGAQDHERESIGGAAARLTRREAEVLQMLACGLDNRTIGETLGVSPTTVRNHIEHLLAKLGVHSKLEAVVYAARHRLV
jgi:two-component system nitrate/nitrite response regulator NarL